MIYYVKFIIIKEILQKNKINLKKRRSFSFYVESIEYYQLSCISTKGGIDMEITDVRVRRISEEGKMKAIISVTFNDQFVVHDIKVIEGQNGLFIAMPSRKMGDGEFRDIAHPINSETRQVLQEAIFAEYEKNLVTV